MGGAAQMELDVEGITYEPKGDIVLGGRKIDALQYPVLSELAKVMSLCNLSNITLGKNGVWERVGESTEAALKVAVEKIGVEGARSKGRGGCAGSEALAAQFETLATLEFSRDRKSMSVIVREKQGKGKGGAGECQLLVKGAPESIVARCSRVMLAKGLSMPMTEAMRQEIVAKVEGDYGSGSNALRCLAHAVVWQVDPRDPRLLDPQRFGELESDMTFIGLVGILDPPRVEVRPAIETCRRAGIRVIVITGDNQKTAESICRKIGVFEDGEDLAGKSYTGREFGLMSRAKQIKAVQQASLFSRTEPMHKQQIVERLQLTEEEGGPGEVAAMTGDGVNDAPALHAADIGVAMGSGTAVAQGAAKMVLADDNFTTIVNAVEEGRAIYNNTKAFIRYLISSNIGEVVCIFLAVLLGIPEVLVPVTLLWVNLVTDGLPATALSFNPPETDIMSKPPRRRDEQLLSGWILVRYFVIGAYVGVACIGGFLWWQMFYTKGPMMSLDDLRNHLDCKGKAFQNGLDCEVMEDLRPKTISLSILVVVEMFNSLNAISENESLLTMPPWVNPWLLATIALSMAQHLLILSVSSLAGIFQVQYLNHEEWAAIVMFSFPVILLDEALKIVSRRKQAREEEELRKKR